MVVRNSLMLLLYLKSKKKKDQMSQYLTPLKDSTLNHQRQPKTVAPTRDGDWVCYNCNNLNFSFRKKCNRCKTQTREQNQQVSAYYFEYLPKNCYYVDEKQNFPSLHTSLSHLSSTQKTQYKNQNSNVSKGAIDPLQLTPDKATQKQELPSVSPLVKRYNRHENNSTQESKNKGLFENETIWANIDLNYLQEPSKPQNQSQGQEKQYQISELQKIIEKIML